METNCNTHIEEEEEEDHHVGNNSSKLQFMMVKWKILFIFLILFWFAVAHNEEIGRKIYYIMT